MIADDFLRYARLDHGLDARLLASVAPTPFARIGFQPRGYAPAANVNPTVIEERPLNVAQMDVFSRLMMDRIIFLGTAVDDYVANVIQAQLLFLASADADKPVTLYINSPGGSVTAGLGIYDTMQLVSCPVHTTCTNIAASMASVLLCAGAAGKRSMLPHARVMIHQPSGGMQGMVADMERSYKLILDMQRDLYAIYERHTGQPEERIRADADRDCWMRAEEALEYGIVDEVMALPETEAARPT